MDRVPTRDQIKKAVEQVMAGIPHPAALAVKAMLLRSLVALPRERQGLAPGEKVIPEGSLLDEGEAVKKENKKSGVEKWFNGPITP